MSVDKLNWTENGQTFFCYFFRDKLSLLRSSYYTDIVDSVIIFR